MSNKQRNSRKRCTRRTKSSSKLHARLNKCKELEEIVIKASKDLRTKDELINQWKEKSTEAANKFNKEVIISLSS